MTTESQVFWTAMVAGIPATLAALAALLVAVINAWNSSKNAAIADKKIEDVHHLVDGSNSKMTEELKQLRQQVSARAQHDIQTAADVIQQARLVVPMPVLTMPLPPIVPLPPVSPLVPTSNVQRAAIDAIQGIEVVAQAVEEVPQKTTDLVVEKIKPEEKQ